MSTAIVVAEDLGNGFWLEDGVLMAGAILADGSGFDEAVEVGTDGGEDLRERHCEILRLLRELGPRPEFRRVRHSLQMSSGLQ